MGLAVCLENELKDYEFMQEREINGWQADDLDDPTQEIPLMDEYVYEEHFGVDFTSTKTKEG